MTRAIADRTFSVHVSACEERYILRVLEVRDNDILID